MNVSPTPELEKFVSAKVRAKKQTARRQTP